MLIYPPYERFRGTSFAHFPIGLGFLATMLNNDGYEARIYNADFGPVETERFGERDIVSRTQTQDVFSCNALDDNHYIWKEIRQRLSDYQPDMVGIYTTTVAYPIALKILSIMKEMNKDCVTILGGPHPTVLPAKVMEIADVDFLLMGEAEFTLPKLCEEIKNGSRNFQSIAGLGYRENGNVVINKDYAFNDDICDLPVVDREVVFDRDSYPNNVLGGTILGSRGCPHRCTFCASVMIWKRHIRYRSVENIIAELKDLKEKYGLTRFSFYDDTFTSHAKKAREFCEKLIEENIGLNWTCLTRADLINEPMLDLLKRSGCTAISVGIESGSDRVLKAMKKGITTETIRNAVRLIKRHQMEFYAFFMVGLPYEKAEDIRMTINIIKEIRPDHMNLSTFFPYPGTEAHEETVKLGMLDADYDWATNLEIGHHSMHNCFTPHIPKDEFQSLVVEALETARQANAMTLRKRLNIYWQRKGFYLKHPEYIVKRFLAIVSRKASS